MYSTLPLCKGGGPCLIGTSFGAGGAYEPIGCGGGGSASFIFAGRTLVAVAGGGGGGGGALLLGNAGIGGAGGFPGGYAGGAIPPAGSGGGGGANGPGAAGIGGSGVVGVAGSGGGSWTLPGVGGAATKLQDLVVLVWAAVLRAQQLQMRMVFGVPTAEQVVPLLTRVHAAVLAVVVGMEVEAETQIPPAVGVVVVVDHLSCLPFANIHHCTAADLSLDLFLRALRAGCFMQLTAALRAPPLSRLRPVPPARPRARAHAALLAHCLAAGVPLPA